MNFLLARLVTVQLQAKLSQADDVKIALHHFQRREFLRDKKHGFALVQSRRNHVGDRLRLARARRTFDDEIASFPCLQDGRVLRTVRFYNERNIVSDRMVVGNIDTAIASFFCLRKTAFEDLLDERVLQQSASLGPASRVEVDIHPHLREGEEADERSLLDLPSLAASNRSRHLGEVFLRISRFLPKLWQVEAEVRAQALH